MDEPLLIRSPKKGKVVMMRVKVVSRLLSSSLTGSSDCVYDMSLCQGFRKTSKKYTKIKEGISFSSHSMGAPVKQRA